MAVTNAHLIYDWANIENDAQAQKQVYIHLKSNL